MGKKYNFSGEVDGFKMLDEGSYIFKILSADFDEIKDAVVVKLVTQDGEKHTEFFNLVKANSEVNNFQVKHIIRLCATALNDDALKKQPFDTDVLADIKGKFFQGTIQHSTYNGKTKATLAPFDYAVSEGFNVADDLDDL